MPWPIRVVAGLIAIGLVIYGFWVGFTLELSDPDPSGVIPGPWIIVPLFMIVALVLSVIVAVGVRIAFAAAKKKVPFDLILSLTVIVGAGVTIFWAFGTFV